MLNEAITTLSGIGPGTAQKFERLGVQKVADLLFQLPYNYQDRTQFIPIGSLKSGDSGLFHGVVEHANVVYRKRRSLLVRISDNTGFIWLRYFYFSKQQAASLKPGQWVSAYGDVRVSTNGLECVHPEYRVSSQQPTIENPDLTPIYHLTDGISQTLMRKTIAQALKHIDELQDPLAQYYNSPIDLKSAILRLHRPKIGDDLNAIKSGEHDYIQRLAFEELLAYQLSLHQYKKQRDLANSFKIKNKPDCLKQFFGQLKFELTGAQKRVVKEIFNDLSKGNAMQRLLQGDVGSGKTVVAAAAAVQTISNGYQVAIMAPTELLTEQHMRSFSEWLEPLGFKTTWLSSRVKPAQRDVIYQQISNGDVQMVIGTHALFQAGVEFKNLGLVIVDEQHRFGVNQRLALINKGQNEGIQPHQLIMTATPIPRSLAMTFYADLDVSSIDELPPGRKPIETSVISAERRDEIIQRVMHYCKQGQQVYWVCCLIEESDAIEAQAAQDTYEMIREQLTEVSCGLIHGRLKSAEKDTIMKQFRGAEIDLLVATTVIEVGVDVPNASLMIIENAERLGLAQLHQLRGRIGRGSAQSSCILLYKKPLSQMAKQRLQVMRETNDGFKIALKDLELRGPGELLGTRQSGAQQLRIANISRDQELLPDVTKVANQLYSEESPLIDIFLNRWISHEDKYAHV